MLADGFKSGSASLLVKPSKELLALKDPYDPAQNGPYRLHDASLYHGKYYIYFGPVPAIVLFMPLDILLQVRLNQSTAVAVFLSLALISSTLLLRFLNNKIRPPIPFWMFVAAVAAVGFCNAGPFLLTRPDVYEVAIACAFFFATTAIHLVLSGTFSEKPAPWKMTVGSLCAGLAVGSRPTFVIFGIILPIIALAFIRHSRLKWNSRSGIQGTACLLLPFGLCVLGLLAYNYARFGSLLEFGSHYQLQAIHPKDYPIFRPDLFLARLHGYLFYGYKLDGQFPFVHVPRGTIFGEPEAGTLLINPIFFLAFLWLLVSLRNKAATPQPDCLLLCFTTLFGAGVMVVILLSVIAHPLIRYHVDYEGILLAGALMAWWDLSQRYASRPTIQKTVRMGGAALISYGCWVGFAFGWNDISPTAIRRFYDGNNLAAHGDPAQAVAEYREAVRISPDFALAESTLAQALAAQGLGLESASHFSAAMRQFITTNVAYKDRGYMPAFQGMCITDPFNEYLRLAQILLQHRQIDEALLALDGLVKAFCEAGFCDQAINGADAIAKMAASSNQGEFASRIEDRVRQYRTSASPSK